jgi:hypothetical protein
MPTPETMFNPPPGQWGALRYGDTDTRTKNFQPDLSQIPDTISSVTNVNITRDDGQTMGSSDLQMTALPGVDSTNTQVTVQLSQGIAGVEYNVEIIIATVGGRTLGRDTTILVSGAVG